MLQTRFLALVWSSGFRGDGPRVNKSVADWGEVCNDQVLATAILDRLLHDAATVNIKGHSYRLRERKTAGLLGRRPKPADAEEAAASA